MQRASPGHLLCYEDSVCKEGGTGWGVFASGADWGADAALITHSSCIPTSHDQKLLLISHLPIFAKNKRRKTPPLDEVQYLTTFADKQKTGQRIVWESVLCGFIWITCLGEHSLNSMCFSGATWKAKWLMLRARDVRRETAAALEYNDWKKRLSCSSPTGQNSPKTLS